MGKSLQQDKVVSYQTFLLLPRLIYCFGILFVDKCKGMFKKYIQLVAALYTFKFLITFRDPVIDEPVPLF